MKFRPIVKKILTWLLIAEAKTTLLKYKPKIVLITGSVGKTSSKNAIYTTLRRFTSVRKNVIEGNALGLALTIIGGDPRPNLGVQFKNLLKGFFGIVLPRFYPKWLILELSIREPGDFREIRPWLFAEVVLVTYFGGMPPHIEFFKSREYLISEKLEVLANLKKDGLVIANSDDPDFSFTKSKIKSKFVTFGLNESADFYASNIQMIYENGLPIGLNFKINYEGNSLPINIRGVLGKNHVYAFLAGLALAHKWHFNILEASQEAANFACPWGRLCLVAGKDGSLIIDDSYNSSPTALIEALQTLDAIKAKERKIAVLGDMLELGRDTLREHEKAGELAGRVAHFLVTIGPRAESIKRSAMSRLTEKNCRHFQEVEGAADFLKSFLRSGDIILIKGSRKMGLERIVAALKAF